MSLTLHEHPFASYCWKALIALYERNVPFEAKLVLDQADRERLTEIWPMGGIPVLADDESGLTVPESTTVIEYLDRFGAAPPLIPADPDAAIQARLWDRIFDAHVMTPMQKIVADSLRAEGREDPEGVAEAKAGLDRAYEMLDGHLEGAEWAAGPDFTIADCAAAPSLFYARIVHRWNETELPELTGYFEKVSDRPSVARVIEEARPYRELFPLPWPAYAD